MCGQFLMMSMEGQKNWQDRRDAIKDMFVFDTVRGWDSTGLFAVPSKKNDDIVTIKKAIMGPDFIQLPKVNQTLMNVDRYRFFIGHNRAATKGGVNNTTAHPFWHGDVIGVHNGTLHSGRGLKDYHDFQVDSEALMYNLAEGNKDNIIPKLDGAFALIWYDDRDNSLHVVRNEKRSFGFVKVKGEDTIFAASEVKMLEAALARRRMEVEYSWDAKVGREYIFHEDNPLKFTTKDHELYEPPAPNYGYGYGFGTFPPSNSNLASLPDKRSKIAKETKSAKNTKANELKKKYGLDQKEKVEVYPLSFQSYGNSSLGCMQCCVQTSDEEWWDAVVHQVHVKDWEDKWEDEICTADIGTVREYATKEVVLILLPETLVHAASSPFDEDVVDIQTNTHKFIGPGGELIGRKDWDKHTRHGCAYCQSNIFDSDDRKIVWTQDSQPICPNCTMDKEASIH